METSAKMSDGHLLLRITCTIRLEQFRPFAILHPCKRTYWEALPHCRDTTSEPSQLSAQVNAALRQATREDGFALHSAAYSERTYICPNCPARSWRSRCTKLLIKKLNTVFLDHLGATSTDRTARGQPQAMFVAREKDSRPSLSNVQTAVYSGRYIWA